MEIKLTIEATDSKGKDHEVAITFSKNDLFNRREQTDERVSHLLDMLTHHIRSPK